MDHREKQYLSKYTKLKRLLEERIRKGFFRHGDELPPEKELADFFNVSRNTVRRALESLANEGLVSKHHGRVSRICIDKTGSGLQRANRLAYFSNYLPGMVHVNMVYWNLFDRVIEAAAAYDLEVDFFSTESPDCWSMYQKNRSIYMGAFSVGVNQDSVSRGVFERLAAIPDLIVLDELENMPGEYCVSVDNYAGGRMAARHLLQCNLRNMVMLTPDSDFLPFRQRIKGFEDELSEHGHVNCSVRKIIGIDSVLKSEPGWLDSLHHLLLDADGCFCYCDLLALQALNAAYYHNRPVPDSLSVIGFDGIAIGQHTFPQLTSLAHPARQVADAAIQMALALYNKQRVRRKIVRIPGKLLPGETTRIFKASR
ncbi:MAG: GntR family transcriptional regulator [Lentisphaerae bacterium]|nr:GntR family transcriptional regulator [Lentisphaerota bacterium]